MDTGVASFQHYYQLEETIARDAHSSVHRAVHRQNGRQYAVKIVDVGKVSNKELATEIEISALLKHPYIIELYETFSSDGCCYLVFEYLDGLDICFEVVKRAAAGFVYSEAVVSHYMKQLMHALCYTHERGVVHRHIRAQCTLLANKENSAPIKLCNFANAAKLADAHSLIQSARVGSAAFMAPEIAAGHAYGTAADIWSTGVLMYLLLSGQLPFVGTQTQVLDSVLRGAYSLKGPMWEHVSDFAKDLLVKMLTVDGKQRITAADALRHPFLKERERCASRRHLHECVAEMRKYNSKRRLMSRVIAATSSDHWSARCLIDEDAMSGVDFILDTLEMASTLETRGAADQPERSNRVLEVLNDDNLQILLDLYDRIATLDAPAEAPPTDVTRWVREVQDAIDRGPIHTAEAAELRSILTSVHIQAVLQAHDVIAHEVYGGGPSTSHHRAVTPPIIAPQVLTSANEHNRVMTPPLPTSMSNNVSCNNYDDRASSRPGTSHDSHNEEDLISQVTRVRLVQFQKNTDEPMGITLKVGDDGRCAVARIMHGGMIHRQGTLHVGDEIREINGASVANQTVDRLQRMLRDVRGAVTFKIVPSYRSAPPACEIFVRAQFDYDPTADDLIPCPQAGVRFSTGDILQVISKDDHNWWQARHVAPFPALGHLSNAQSNASIAGLIPSPQLQEWRTACLAVERSKDTANCMWFNKKKKFSTKYLQKHSTIFDQLDLVTYEECVRLPTFRRRTLVLLGAHGVGRRHIKNTLIQRHPDRYAYPIPHTTRPQRKDETDGRHYHFVSHDAMMADIQQNEYLEYGTHEDYLYGTKLDTIRQIHRQGKLAILDVEPQALKVLRSAEYSPFVVFIAAPNLHGLQDPDGSLERLLRESESLRQAFGHYFDYVILNNDIDETIRQLEIIMEKLHAQAQWVPVAWVY